MRTGVEIFCARKTADHGEAVHLRQHAIDHENVVGLVATTLIALDPVAGGIGDVSRLAERLDQILSRLDVVFDDKNAHAATYRGFPLKRSRERTTEMKTGRDFFRSASGGPAARRRQEYRRDDDWISRSPRCRAPRNACLGRSSLSGARPCGPSFLAAAMIADVMSLGLETFWPASLEDHVADLQALLRGGAVGIDIGDHHAVGSGAGDRGGRRQLQAERGGRRLVLVTADLSLGDLIAVGQRAELDVGGLLRALDARRSARPWRRDRATRSCGPSSRGPSTFSPSTPRITSPDLMPAAEAGPVGCASATRAPFVDLRPRLSAISSGDRLDLHADPAARDLTARHQVLDDRLRDFRGDREADADAAARRREDRGVDADDLAGAR